MFSAICVVFAHGAGEVGFMAGPLSAIYDVYQNGHLSKSLQPQIWCVVLGAVSLVVGLATYGYNVTRCSSHYYCLMTVHCLMKPVSAESCATAGAGAAPGSCLQCAGITHLVGFSSMLTETAGQSER